MVKRSNEAVSGSGHDSAAIGGDTVRLLQEVPHQNNAGDSILSYRFDDEEEGTEWVEVWTLLGENMPAGDQIDLSGDSSDAESI